MTNESPQTPQTPPATPATCPLCGAPLANPAECSRCDWQRETAEEAQQALHAPRNFTAALLSLFPGLGQVYKGHMRRGLTMLFASFLVIFFAILFTMFAGWLLVPLYWLYVMFDAFLIPDLKNGEPHPGSHAMAHR